MNTATPEWERRIAALWAGFDDYAPSVFLAKIQSLSAELPQGHPFGLFEVAAANDSTGHHEQAVLLYRQALAAGLIGDRRRRAVIQLSGSLRVLGQAQESVALLLAEREAGSDHLDDAVIAFLALALAETGKAKEAAILVLSALARHLPQYSHTVRHHTRLLGERPASPAPPAPAGSG